VERLSVYLATHGGGRYRSFPLAFRLFLTTGCLRGFHRHSIHFFLRIGSKRLAIIACFLTSRADGCESFVASAAQNECPIENPSWQFAASWHPGPIPCLHPYDWRRCLRLRASPVADHATCDCYRPRCQAIGESCDRNVTQMLTDRRRARMIGS